MDDFLAFLGAYYVIPSIVIGGIGFLLGWFLKPSTKRAGDLSVEGEGALRAETDTLRTRVQDLEGRLSARETELTELKTQATAQAELPDAVPTGSDVTAKTTDTDDTYALEWQNRYLAARVKYLDSRLAEMSEADDVSDAAASAKKPKKTKVLAKPKKTAMTKAKTKAVAKTATAKTGAAKTTAKATTAKKAAAKKAPAKAMPTKSASAKSASKASDEIDRYLEKVKAYDARASKKVVQNIVDYCGISLQSRDSSLVACSDEAELRRVASGFVTKKLGLEEGQLELVKSVCEQMKGQRLKSRVTFYYLAAKKAKKLSLFR
ncbi:DUF2853 family protein [uncultured Algimonas sp.]|uniref:DUF2853 family protein n=1 Tax=uncultured Algimonas sp. TaxID=1547920 RepID=UPI002602CFEE|nr:DUF2853 family protein [uncultured Algimonas sp.]